MHEATKEKKDVGLKLFTERRTKGKFNILLKTSCCLIVFVMAVALFAFDIDVAVVAAVVVPVDKNIQT